MQTVIVYQYEGFSISEGKTIRPGTYATLEYITRNQLTPVLESKREVAPSSLDIDGRCIDSEE